VTLPPNLVLYHLYFFSLLPYLCQIVASVDDLPEDLASPLSYLVGRTALIGFIVTFVFTAFSLLVTHETGITSIVYVPTLRYL
jgi:hypothetical protein